MNSLTLNAVLASNKSAMNNNPTQAQLIAMITKLLESNVTQLNIRSPDAEKMK
jgi:hypothetical protein